MSERTDIWLRHAVSGPLEDLLRGGHESLLGGHPAAPFSRVPALPRSIHDAPVWHNRNTDETRAVDEPLTMGGMRKATALAAAGRRLVRARRAQGSS